MDGKGAWMSVKEAGRYAVIQRVLQGQLSQAVAAEQLGIGVRQIKRLCAAVRLCGAQSLISQKRGKPSNRGVSAQRRQHYLELVRQHYPDFGPQLASEYLRKEHGFTQSAETLRLWMVQAGLWKTKVRRAQRIHSPRQRRARLGELVQIDGSPHAWFEERAPKSCLIAFIDDATGKVLAARFAPTETTQAYFDVLHSYIKAHGVPLALYSDRHSIFTKHDREDPVPTQFERALLQLGIEPIQAHSPQAKGRVERLFLTLQDRMVKALRLANISGIEQANVWLADYLQAHNERFSVTPREAQDAHIPYAGKRQELGRICALHHQRQLSAQLSCQFEGAVLQIHPGQSHAPQARAKADIVQYGDGSVELLYRGQVLRHSSYGLHGHLRDKRVVDDKGLNARVDQVAQSQYRRIERLKAELAHQDAQRDQGVYSADTHTSAPPRAGTGRYGLRPSQPVPAAASSCPS